MKTFQVRYALSFLTLAIGWAVIQGSLAKPVHSQNPLGNPTPNLIPNASQGQGGGYLPMSSASSTSSAAAGNLISHIQTLPNGITQQVLVDASLRSIACYHIDPSTGVISLRSVRKIDADLMLEEFNGTAPLPAEVRKVVQ